MAKAIVLLSVNAGSSSVKATLFQADADGAEEQLARIAAAEVSGLSAPPAEFSYLRGDEKHKHQFPSSISTHHDAFQYILESFFNDRDLRAVSGKDQVDYVCHRIVHGVGGEPPFINWIRCSSNEALVLTNPKTGRL